MPEGVSRTVFTSPRRRARAVQPPLPAGHEVLVPNDRDPVRMFLPEAEEFSVDRRIEVDEGVEVRPSKQVPLPTKALEVHDWIPIDQHEIGSGNAW